jgi:hypothetical protein
MQRVKRVLLIGLSALPALALGAWLWLAAPPASPARAAALPALTPTPSPPVFSATLDVIPDRRHVLIGETLVVTLNLTVAVGCQYPVYEAQLTQTGHNLPAFAYIDPITATVGPGVAMPFSYTLQAIASGYVTLDGRLDGEKNCGDGWQWLYIDGTSPSIKVGEWPYMVRLPVVGSAAAP